MPQVYLDNAATTQMDPEVLVAMLPYMQEWYANPSSPHHAGNQVRTAIDSTRRTMQACLGADEGHIFFTSGGTEANNWAIYGAIMGLRITHVITSPLEHLSVLTPIQQLATRGIIRYTYLTLKSDGSICYDSLTKLLVRYPRSLVSLMHGNNEVGNLTDLHAVGELCRAYGATFHSDMVQTIPYVPIHLGDTPVDICTGSAHKFHGPKGAGFLYVRPGLTLTPLLQGGAQERGQRGGTENVPAIIGMGKALSIACQERATTSQQLQARKTYTISQLQGTLGIQFHGQSARPKLSLPSILSVGLPHADKETILLHLSMEGIAISSGSACMSGSQNQSHVLQALGVPDHLATLRFSLSKYTTQADIDFTLNKLRTIGALPA